MFVQNFSLTNLWALNILPPAAIVTSTIFSSFCKLWKPLHILPWKLFHERRYWNDWEIFLHYWSLILRQSGRRPFSEIRHILDRYYDVAAYSSVYDVVEALSFPFSLRSLDDDSHDCNCYARYCYCCCCCLTERPIWNHRNCSRSPYRTVRLASYQICPSNYQQLRPLWPMTWPDHLPVLCCNRTNRIRGFLWTKRGVTLDRSLGRWNRRPSNWRMAILVALALRTVLLPGGKWWKWWILVDLWEMVFLFLEYCRIAG